MKNMQQSNVPKRPRRLTLRGPVRVFVDQAKPGEGSLLDEILTAEKYEFVDSPLFHQKDADKVIFDDAPAIEQVFTGWYRPMIEGMDAKSVAKARQSGSVLLTAAQERALFRQFNYCRMRAVTLREKLLKQKRIRKDSKTVRDAMHWHSRAAAYRDQIAGANLALVLAMAKRARVNDVEFADLVSEGNMALLRAVDKFDVDRGFKFSTYACRAILKAFSRMGMKQSRHRQMFPTDFDPAMERSDWDDRRREQEQDERAGEIRAILAKNSAELSEIEQEVIEHRFAVGRRKVSDNEDGPLTLEQVGKIIGVTKERVRQIQNKALEKIRRSLEIDRL